LHVLQQLREDGIKAPVIVLTGQGDEQLAVEIMKAGAVDYLPKNGLIPERLRQAVTRSVRVRRAEISAEAERRRVSRLHSLMTALAATRTVSDVARATMTQGLEAFHAARGLLALQADGGGELQLVRADGYPEHVLEGWRRIPLSTSVPLTESFSNGEPLYFETAADLVSRYVALGAEAVALSQSVVVLPLSAGQSVLGVAALSYDTEQHFDDDLRRDMTSFARACAQALERALLFELANRERRRAEEASRTKDEFLAVVSHELRTPLNAILGWATMLRDGSLSPERAIRAASVIERNARSQAQLIDDLLDVSRIITGKMRVELRPVELAKVAEAALEVTRPAAEAKGVLLESSVDHATSGACVVLGDAERLQQVLWNLLSNAIKFTPRGGVVKAQLSSVDGYCVYRVQDSGKGMAREFLPHAFERFRQEDTGTTRKSGGLGLGLAIVRHIVDLHGGSAEVDSPGVGMGTTFTIRLPASDVPASAHNEKPSPARPVEIAPFTFRYADQLRDKRILVVDDEDDARELLVSILKGCACEVMHAAGATEALALIRQAPPDIIVSDLGMPHEDGFSFIERVRELSDAQGGLAIAVALTAYARSEDRSKALLAGFDAHVAKPVELHRLLELLVSLATKNPRS
jgi:signal transduction histidine kinase/DNA-binding NarL/FixJ family response regulator